MEIILEHADAGTNDSLALPKSMYTVLEIKDALVKQLGKGKSSEVKFFFKTDGGLEACQDTDCIKPDPDSINKRQRLLVVKGVDLPDLEDFTSNWQRHETVSTDFGDDLMSRQVTPDSDWQPEDWEDKDAVKPETERRVSLITEMFEDANAGFADIDDIFAAAEDLAKPEPSADGITNERKKPALKINAVEAKKYTSMAIGAPGSPGAFSPTARRASLQESPSGRRSSLAIMSEPLGRRRLGAKIPTNEGVDNYEQADSGSQSPERSPKSPGSPRALRRTSIVFAEDGDHCRVSPTRLPTRSRRSFLAGDGSPRTTRRKSITSIDPECFQPKSRRGSLVADTDTVPPQSGYEKDAWARQVSWDGAQSNGKEDIMRRQMSAPEGDQQALPISAELLHEQKLMKMKNHMATKGNRVRVAVVANGHHGDIRPFVALSKALEKMDYAVCCFIPTNFEALCAEHGVYAMPTFGDLHAVLGNAGGGPDTLQERWDIELSMKEWFERYESTCVAIEDALEELQPSFVIHGNMWSIQARRYEQDNDVPCIPVYLNTEEIWSRESIYVLERNEKVPRPIIFAVSELLCPCPWGTDQMQKKPKFVMFERDNGEAVKFHNLLPVFHHIDPMGAFLEEKAGKPTTELETFLSQGSPPVAAGWGSAMPRRPSPESMLCTLLHALKATGHRGVVVGGWHRLHLLGKQLVKNGTLPGFGSDDAGLAEFARKNVCFVEQVSHDWLLPQCCCLVHHGGVGTVQTAVRLGCPQVVTPVADDQYENGEQVHEDGFGVNLDSLESMSVVVLSDAIEEAINMKDAVMYVSSMMENENGEQQASQVIDTFVKRELKTGKWIEAAKALANQKMINEREREQ